MHDSTQRLSCWLIIVSGINNNCIGQKDHFRKDLLKKMLATFTTAMREFYYSNCLWIFVFFSLTLNTESPKRYYFCIVSRSLLNSRRSLVLKLISQRRLRTLYGTFFVLYFSMILWTQASALNKNREFCSSFRRKWKEAREKPRSWERLRRRERATSVTT